MIAVLVFVLQVGIVMMPVRRDVLLNGCVHNWSRRR